MCTCLTEKNKNILIILIFVSFGFVTFESENDVKKILDSKLDNLIFRDNKLNVSNAYRRHHYLNGTRGNQYQNNHIDTNNSKIFFFFYHCNHFD